MVDNLKEYTLIDNYKEHSPIDNHKEYTTSLTKHSPIDNLKYLKLIYILKEIDLEIIFISILIYKENNINLEEIYLKYIDYRNTRECYNKEYYYDEELCENVIQEDTKKNSIREMSDTIRISEMSNTKKDSIREMNDAKRDDTRSNNHTKKDATKDDTNTNTNTNTKNNNTKNNTSNNHTHKNTKTNNHTNTNTKNTNTNDTKNTNTNTNTNNPNTTTLHTLSELEFQILSLFYESITIQPYTHNILMILNINNLTNNQILKLLNFSDNKNILLEGHERNILNSNILERNILKNSIKGNLYEWLISIYKIDIKKYINNNIRIVLEKELSIVEMYGEYEMEEFYSNLLY